MYLPKQFTETNTEVLHALIQERPFATLVVGTRDGLNVDHIPFLLDATQGPHGTLRGHVARANPLVRAALADVDAVVIFQGPSHYITPSWYATKQQSGEVVPTWNYAVVHAYGRPLLMDDAEWLRTQLNQLTNQHEAKREQPWKVSDAPDEFIARLLRAIVGIEIPISRLEGKWKLGQNRSDADRRGTIDGLLQQNTEAASELAAWSRRALP